MDLEIALKRLRNRRFDFTKKVDDVMPNRVIPIYYAVKEIRTNDYMNIHMLVVNTNAVEFSNTVANHLGRVLINYFGIKTSISRTGNGRNSISMTIKALNSDR